MLQKVRVLKDRNEVDAYELAPLRDALDQSHSEIISQITGYVLEHREDRIVAELCTAPGLLPKLLGGIDHSNRAPRLDCAAQFLTSP
jgi:hypothetical protein